MAVVAVMLVLGAVAALAARHGSHPTTALDQLRVRTVPGDGTDIEAPSPSAPETMAPARPSLTQHGSLVTAAPDTPVTESLTPAGTTGRPSTAPTNTRECVGPLPPGHPAEAECDVGKHSGIPTDCMPMRGCAWWDAWGATPAGPTDMGAHPTSAGQIAVTWATGGDDIAGDKSMGPLRGFLVRIYQDDGSAVLQQYLLAASRRSLTTEGLAPGTYTVLVAEINDSGFSGGVVLQHVTVAAPAGEETAQSTPSPATTPS